MEGTSNDKTIGRTNRSSPSRAARPAAVESIPKDTSVDNNNSVSAADTPTTVEQPLVYTTTVGSKEGPFEWPTNADHYQLINRIGQGAFASVWRARIRRRIKNDGENNEGAESSKKPVEIHCAIKIMDLEHVNINISDIRLEVQTMRLSSHPNVLVCHTSFVRDTDLWLVTQLMSKGSSLHCLQSARAKLLTNAAANAAAAETTNIPDGGIPLHPATFSYTTDDAVLEGGLAAYSSIISPEALLFEAHITYILYETLLGLKYIHDNGQIHRDVKAGNLLLDGNANVRIADFGVSSWLIDSGNRREHTTTFVGTPCWMAPEVMEQVDGYDYKADIWSLGITALELCKGYAPYAKYAPMKVLLLTIQEDPPNLETYNDGDDVNMWSKSFRSMIKLCLQKDRSKRPTTQELLAHRHFKPLVEEDGRAAWRNRTKTELCDEVEDVGESSGEIEGRSSSENLPGASPISIVLNTHKDRPAGTSWILPGGSQIQASSAKGGVDNGQDFFDEFEQQTGGENFNRESTSKKRDVDITDNKKTKQVKEEEDDDDDDMNDFFDEFENATGGENFKRI
eukprot:CAMPEP_0201691250 /NCGR_PEP_ID=MMETSP0578-20130828/4452_1 /ASSEMBLY_ACC=CAM_ASM_000663 /TAXON_ID=267565 /ORGANISM="Skeletonema grethea, Strain CCMP 1804" /LENGTH=566 /DNA_ID=CAMNT_0048176411 /DNA_START=65 /DNA_END=1765 /DNA_ORIENTATION=+